MGKIYCMMGKSSTGKDTLYKMLLGRRGAFAEEDHSLHDAADAPGRNGRRGILFLRRERNWPIF